MVNKTIVNKHRAALLSMTKNWTFKTASLDEKFAKFYGYAD
jgi:hypothetical protein